VLETVEGLESQARRAVPARRRPAGRRPRSSASPVTRPRRSCSPSSASCRSLRDRQAASLPDDLLRRYEEAAARAGGTGVGRLDGNACTACRIELSYADVGELLAGPPLASCPQCRRLLVVPGMRVHGPDGRVWAVARRPTRRGPSVAAARQGGGWSRPPPTTRCDGGRRDLASRRDPAPRRRGAGAADRGGEPGRRAPRRQRAVTTPAEGRAVATERRPSGEAAVGGADAVEAGRLRPLLGPVRGPQDRDLVAPSSGNRAMPYAAWTSKWSPSGSVTCSCWSRDITWSTTARQRSGPRR
jgi:hypothetical protein